MATVNLAPIGNGFNFLNGVGSLPNSGGKINTYLAGTTTPQVTYTTSAGSITNANPIILDLAGRPSDSGNPVEIWLVQGIAYKFVLTDSLNNTIATYDNLLGINDGTSILASLADTSNAALGDALVGVKSTLTGGSGRTQHQKNADFVSLSDFINGTTYTGAWQAAVASGSNKLYIDVSGTTTASIALPAHFNMWTDSASVTKGFNGDMFTVGDVVQVDGLALNGVGGTFTGRGFVVSSGGDQRFLNCYVTDMSGYCLSFTTLDAGARALVDGGFYQRHTTTNASFGMEFSSPGESGNRMFKNVTTAGGWFMDLGASVNTQIEGCAFINMTFTSNTSRSIITANRIAALSGTVAIDGGDINFSDNVIAGDVTLATTSQRCTIGPNNLLTGATVTDNSTATGDNLNVVYETRLSVNPAWSADTTTPAIGNGSLTGVVNRVGRVFRVNIGMGAGSTTTFGTGDWFFTLPSPFSQFKARYDAVGSIRIIDNGTGFFVGICYMAAGTNKIYCYVSNGAAAATTGVRNTFPMAWTTSDNVVLEIAFEGGG